MKFGHGAYLLLSAALLASCTPTLHDETLMRTHTTPESLLHTSTQQVTVPLDHASGLDDLASWISRASRPVRALVQCAKYDKLCGAAKRDLTRSGVPFTEQYSQGGNQVVLTYDMLSVHDCDPRFVDKPYNRYNVTGENYGCSVSSNIVGMVRDKRQFTNPEMLGPIDGTQAAQVYDAYLAGPEETTAGSLLDSAGTQ